ncbi:uncharacterized protein A1O9_02862 [Exophiala aquamarina CBS 119918]|uniref:SRR1-like domain-containing protein n=1 Tax=Exophiala aquamarina CBS 119918 TaxID=1182545 RepID=A0A072PNK6_9EURO|nr:uncharacterized protein A1O9_02862 [Exophiala aquamarina CBS 119918]KEF61297.1 hypothetical protein A1O9_02862 [Exophiala aquamarina CBS 119918]
MPHTSRKKKTSQNKRRQVLDDDGWTRVTTAGGLTAPALLVKNELAQDQQMLHFKWGIGDRSVNIRSWLPGPHKIHPGICLDKMLARYRILEAKWLESTSYAALRMALSKDRVAQHQRVVKTCLIFGSGSFSAAIIGREDVSFYQLAAFKSAIDLIEQVQGHRPESYAQEPYYTELDVELLGTLGISTVSHPRGFELINDNAFAYSPCAERWVELQIMHSQPTLWLHAHLQDRWPLDKDGKPSIVQLSNWMLNGRVRDPQNPDWSSLYGSELDPGVGERRLQEEYVINHQLYEAFKQSHQSLPLPDLNANNFPFQSCALHWPVEDGENTEKAATSPRLEVQEQLGQG